MPGLATTRHDYSAFDDFADGVQVIDPAFRYVYVNGAVASQGHTTPEALLGRTMMEAYPGIETTKMFSALRTCMERRNRVKTTNDFTFPDGTRQYFQLRIEPVADGVLVMSFDITEERAHQILMEDISAELERVVERRTAQLAAKNRELERMTAAASHDLRAPLRAVRGLLDVFMEEYGSRVDAEGVRILRQVVSSATRMGEVIEALLAHAALGRTRVMSDVDITAVVRAAIEDLAPQIAEAEASIELGELPTLRGQAVELRLLFQNLLGNALRYRRPDVACRIQLSAEANGDGFLFSVEDNGIGVAPESQARIFELFRQIDARTERGAGLGIGLAHCEKIVELHGGCIWVESELGKGSRFCFTLQPSTGDSRPPLADD